MPELSLASNVIALRCEDASSKARFTQKKPSCGRKCAPVECGSIYFCGKTWKKENPESIYAKALTRGNSGEADVALRQFLSWACSSAGDWVLIDLEGKRLITSPGSTGLYLDVPNFRISRSVGLLVKNRSPQDEYCLNKCALGWYLTKPSAYSCPISSPFEGIRLIGGGQILESPIGDP